MKKLPAIIGFLLFTLHGLAQDTLPKFTVIAKPMNKNVISWTNPYKNVKQISIQRSTDSLRNFKTILTVPDPTIPQNGYVDSKAPVGINFYKVFIVFENGKYQFSKSQRPAPDMGPVSNEPVLKNDNQRVVLSDSLSNKELTTIKEKLQPARTVKPKPEKYFFVKKGDTVISKIAEKGVQKLRDSLLYSTRDTMLIVAIDTILIKPFIPKEVYKASKFIYTEKNGNVQINLPDAETKKYSLHFFNENRTPLFEIERIPSPLLIIDKSNFTRSGWFFFELFEEGELKEKHKLFIPKDF